MKVQLSKTLNGGLKLDLDVHNDNGGAIKFHLGDKEIGSVDIIPTRPATGNIVLGDDKTKVNILTMYFLPATEMLDGSLRLVCDYTKLDGETSSYGGYIFNWELEVPEELETTEKKETE